MKDAFRETSGLDKVRRLTEELSGAECPEAKGLNYVGLGYREGQDSRDMTLFVDDDEKAYLIHSSEMNSTIHISLLTDDYTASAGHWERAFPERWMEAPCIFKHKGLYYFIASGCSGWDPNPARSAVAESIWGPWKELGNPAIDEDGDTTYHSQSCYVMTLDDGRHIFMGDRWNPKNAVDGRYVWLPIEFENERPLIHNLKSWSL